MNKAIITGLAVFALIGAASCSPADRAPGRYKVMEKRIDGYGTETKKETTTDVYYDKDGRKRAVESTETTRDPEGLFNKTTTETTKTYD